MSKKIKISIEVDGEKFSLNCHEFLYGQWRVKRGRSWSKKMEFSTMTEIFELARKWAVKKVNNPK